MSHSIDEKAMRLEHDLNDLVKTWHNSDPFTAVMIEPKIHEKAMEYQKLTGEIYIYSLAREEQ